MLLPSFDAYFRTCTRSSNSVNCPREAINQVISKKTLSKQISGANHVLPFAAYVGVYVAQGSTAPDVQPRIKVTLVDNVLMVDWNRSRLKFEMVVDQDKGSSSSSSSSSSSHVFRLLPWSGEAWGPAAKSCTRTQMDDWYELFTFHVVEDAATKGKVSSFITLDFVYGVVWNRVV